MWVVERVRRLGGLAPECPPAHASRWDTGMPGGLVQNTWPDGCKPRSPIAPSVSYYLYHYPSIGEGWEGYASTGVNSDFSKMGGFWVSLLFICIFPI